MCEIWNKRMQILEQEVKDSVLKLFQHMGGSVGSASACKLKIEGTSPEVFIVVGDVKAIKRFIE